MARHFAGGIMHIKSNIRHVPICLITYPISRTSQSNALNDCLEQHQRLPVDRHAEKIALILVSERGQAIPYVLPCNASILLSSRTIKICTSGCRKCSPGSEVPRRSCALLTMRSLRRMNKHGHLLCEAAILYFPPFEQPNCR